MSRSELEDELQYNIGRKEELKDDVKKLEKDNEKLKETNRKHVEEFKSTKAAVDDLKVSFAVIRKEREDLREKLKCKADFETENKHLKEKMKKNEETNEKISKDLKAAQELNTRKCVELKSLFGDLEMAKLEISELKHSIKYVQDKNEEVYNNLKTANINLQMENASL